MSSANHHGAAIADNSEAAHEKSLTGIMLDMVPMSALVWTESLERIACNEGAARLFRLSGKQEYLDRFYELSPKYQPCGGLSDQMVKERVRKAFAEGYCRFEWVHQLPDGSERIPAEIVLTRAQHQGRNIVIGYTLDLRDQIASMAKIREADERTQLMLDATPLCCNLWDKNFNNIECNQEAVTLFELSSKQEYLERFYELSPEYQPGGRTSAEMARENIEKAFMEGSYRFEWMHQKLNGDEIPAEITLVRVKYKDDYIVAGYTRDLREQKAALAKIREADERTQLMLDATPLCCNLWDKNFNNIECNQEAVTLFELSSKQEYLDRFFELSPEYQPGGGTSAEMARENIEKAFREGSCRFEWMHQKLNGDEIPAEITLVRVRYKDDYIVAGYTRDLREHKAMLADMQKAHDELRLARDKAQESTRAKSEFVANMSHEIRTPLNGIMGMLHLAMKTELTPKQRNYLANIDLSARNLARIVNDILDFSKIEAGKLEMELATFSLHDIISELHSMFYLKIKEKNVDFIIEEPPTTRQTLIGDPLRLKQVLINLLGNAAKFTLHGEVRLKLEKIGESQERATWAFSVADTGIGMTSAQAAGLFTPFSQADTSITRKFGGTGLGLAISRQLVGMMGGNIWVDSKFGSGSTFRFTASFGIPDKSCCSDQDACCDTGACGASRAGESAHKRILLVEDIDINQMVAEELLSFAGYEVDIANNGAEALEKLYGGSDYAAVLMDIQMPVMDGLTAARKIRQDGRWGDLPIIALSANAMSGDKEKSIECGMNDHISKPFEPDSLYDTLKKWIRA